MAAKTQTVGLVTFALIFVFEIVLVTSSFEHDHDHEGFDEHHSHAMEDARMAGQSASFLTLRDNVIGVLASLPPTVVDGEDKVQLVNAFMDIFRDYEAKTLEDLQPAE
jgi:hypothetical protein